MKKVAGVLFLVFLFSIFAYDPISKAKTAISKKSLSLEIGETGRLKVSGAKSKVFWKSDKPSVAVVSDKGVVLAKHKGKATITAKTKNRKIYYKVVVKNNKITYHNNVFTKKLYSHVKKIQFEEYDKVKTIKSAEGIQKIFSELARRKLVKAPRNTVQIEGGLWLTIVKKDGKKINIVVGSQIIVDGEIYYPDESQVVEKIRKLMDKYGK